MYADRNTAIALAAVLTVWFFSLLIAAKGLFSQETAAWIQAIGAIGAIFAAGWAAQVPLKQEIKRRRDADEHLLKSIDLAGALVAHDLSRVRGAVASDNIGSFKTARENLTVDGLTTLARYLELPITTWPSVSIYIAARDLCAKAGALIEAVQSIKTYIIGEKVFASLQDATAAFDKAHQKFQMEIHFQRFF